MGFICAKKKGQRRIPTALGSGKPATPKNNAYPFGCGCIRCLQKIFQIYRIDLQKENKSQTSENKCAVL